MEGQTIHLCAESGDQAGVVKWISSGADVNQPDSSNRSPLHYAAISGHTSIVALLLSSGSSVNCQTNRGATPLHYSARSGNVECLSLLLENGGDVNCRDSSGNTPLHAAINCHEVKAALALVQNYGSDVNIQNKEDQSPLFLACQMGYKDVIIQLLEKGAKTNVRDKSGNTCLSVLSFIEIEKKEELEELIYNGKSTSLENDIGSLMYVVKKATTTETNGNNTADQMDTSLEDENTNIGIYSDITLIVEGHSIPAHRSILASRCPHFKSLLKKSNSSEIEITDVKFNLFILLLEWIYKDKLKEIIKPDQIDLSSAFSLLVLAERYQIKALVGVCEKFLIHNLTTTTIVSVWPELKKTSNQLKQSCPELMRSCAQFIIKNWNVLSVSKMGDLMNKVDFVNLINILPIKPFDPNEPIVPQQPTSTTTTKPSKSSSSGNSNAPATTAAATTTTTTRQSRASTGGSSSKSSATPKKSHSTSSSSSSSTTSSESTPTTDIMDKKNLELCNGIYTQIYKRKNAEVFHYPVDPVADGVPTYLDIIKNPMDLGTMKTKLDNGSYKTIKEFAADMRLMFINALTFNLDGTPIWKLAKSLLQNFNTKFGQTFPFEPIPEIPIIAPSIIVGTNNNNINNNNNNNPPETPEKKRKSTPAPSTTATTTNVPTPTTTEIKPENIKKKYTDDDRRILMEKINDLNEAQLQNILDIIEPKAIKQNDEGVEIDIIFEKEEVGVYIYRKMVTKKPTKAVSKKKPAAAASTTRGRKKIQQDQSSSEDEMSVDEKNNSSSEGEEESNSESEQESSSSSEDEKKKKKTTPTKPKAKPSPSKKKKPAAASSKKKVIQQQEESSEEEESEEESSSSEEELPKPKPSSQPKKQSSHQQSNKNQKQFQIKNLKPERLNDTTYISSTLPSNKLIKRLMKIDKYLYQQPILKNNEYDIISKSLLTNSLLETKDSEVKLVLASCLAEIIRLDSEILAQTSSTASLKVYQIFKDELFGLYDLDESLFPQYYHLVERLESIKIFSGLDQVEPDSVPPFILKMLNDLVAKDGLATSLVPLFENIIISTLESIKKVPSEIWDRLTEFLLEGEKRIVDRTTGSKDASELPPRILLARSILSTKSFKDPYRYYLRSFHSNDLAPKSKLLPRRNEILYSVFKLNPNLISVYDFSQDIHNEDPSLRKHCVMVLSKLFTSSLEFEDQYSDIFIKFIKRFEDADPKIRILLLDFSQIYSIDSTYGDVILDFITKRLSDTVHEIRSMSIFSLTKYMIRKPQLVSIKIMEKVYDRLRDKETNVRKDAITKLATVFQILRTENGDPSKWDAHLKSCFGSIPTKLVSCFGMYEVDKFFTEVSIDTILLGDPHGQKNNVQDRTYRFLELYGYLDNKSKEHLFQFFEKKSTLQREFTFLYNTVDEKPKGGKKATAQDEEKHQKDIEKAFTYLYNQLPKFQNENPKHLLKSLFDHKKEFKWLKVICDENTTYQEQHNIKVDISNKKSTSKKVTDQRFYECIKYLVFYLSFGIIGKEHLAYIFDYVRQDITSKPTDHFDIKTYSKDIKSLPEPIELLVKLSSIFPSLFRGYEEELISFLYYPKAITNEFLLILYNTIDSNQFRPSKSILKKLQEILRNLCEIGSPKIVKMSFRLLDRITLNKEQLKTILKEMGEEMVTQLQEQSPKNVISSLVTLGLIARFHHSILDQQECYEFMEILVYKQIMNGTCKLDVNTKALGKLDYAYSKDALLRIHGIYYLGNYLVGLPSEQIKRKVFELTTFLFDIIYRPDKLKKLSSMEQYHIQLSVNFEIIRMLRYKHFIMCFQPVHFIAFCNVASIRTEIKNDHLQHRFFSKLEKAIKLNRLQIKFMAAFGMTANQPASITTSIKRQVSSIIKMKRMAISRTNVELKGEILPEHSFPYFIYLISHRPTVEKEYPNFEETSKFFKYYTNMMIEEKDNYSILMNYLDFISQSMDQMDPYSKDTRRVAKHGLQILAQEYKDKKWKTQKFSSLMILPVEYFRFSKDIDFEDYDKDTSDKLPNNYVVTTGKGADRLHESPVYIQQQKNKLEKEKKEKEKEKEKENDPDQDMDKSKEEEEEVEKKRKSTDDEIEEEVEEEEEEENEEEKEEKEEEEKEIKKQKTKKIN
ncbi:ankyrin repeat-containing protein [Cavenderia fasciculata]|uniref:Ankyrin repeat-containing protein n=1 Tax=Cavenderia fasciculata TaxID=261658 RepID=F4QCV7_CACFS|nr:ankyrin repeat-containing protein [Cavenderia fasciculata]EGG14481.1 ankyrin repeat-containing protein [Cavenderia fasciculata]|eukprot:XP_004353890.1 ankyrin repeat-containing protein [Cavenderia fasciculata]